MLLWTSARKCGSAAARMAAADLCRSSGGAPSPREEMREQLAAIAAKRLASPQQDSTGPPVRPPPSSRPSARVPGALPRSDRSASHTLLTNSHPAPGTAGAWVVLRAAGSALYLTKSHFLLIRRYVDEFTWYRSDWKPRIQCRNY